MYYCVMRPGNSCISEWIQLISDGFASLIILAVLYYLIFKKIKQLNLTGK